MRPYQAHGVEFLAAHPRAAVWDDMGLGKTITAATALLDLITAYDAGRALIVAPKRVALSTWPTEFRQWQHLTDIKLTVITGNAPQRRMALAESRYTDAATISETSLSWLVTEYPDEHFDTLILDESDLYKSEKSARTKAATALAKRATTVWQLCATPAAESYHELWAQVFMLDNGDRLGKTYQWFCAKFYVDQYDPVELKKNAEKAINKRVSDLVLRRSAGDYVDVPELIEVTVPVDIPLEAMDIYQEAEAGLYSDSELNEEQIAMKLRQIASGRVKTDQGVDVIHDAKQQAFIDTVDSLDGPCIAVYAFRAERDAILDAYPQARELDDDPATVDAWNAGEVPMLVMHPKAGGHGLNLQYGGRYLIFYSPEWSLRLTKQTIGRLARQGQTHPVVSYTLTARDTIDGIIVRSLKNKSANLDEILEGVRRAAEKRKV